MKNTFKIVVNKRNLLLTAFLSAVFFFVLTVTVHAVSIKDPDGFVIERKYSYGSGYEVRLVGYEGDKTDLKLPAKVEVDEAGSKKEYPVTIVGGNFLKPAQKEKITSVEVPEGYKVIEVGAFKDCKALKTAKISAGVGIVSASAFENCSALENLVFSDGSVPLSLKNNAFAGCTSLENVELPTRLKADGDGLNFFVGCTSLKAVSMKENDKFVVDDNGALYTKTEKGLVLTIFPQTKLLKSFTVPDTVKGNKVTAIGVAAFSKSVLLERVKVPASISTVKRMAFDGCSNIKEIQLLSATLENVDEMYKAFAGLADGSVITVENETVLNALKEEEGIFTPGKTTVQLAKPKDSKDVNDDGKTDILDLTEIHKFSGIKASDADWERAKVADFNGDAKVDFADMAALYSEIYK